MSELNELYQAAIQARSKAYVPYSHFSVGAALLTKSGKIFTGCNVENAAYPSSTCAERTAVAKAVSEGERDFKAVLVVADGERPCSPCGSCRQILAEFSPEMEVIMANLKGATKTCSLKELLPETFKLEGPIKGV